MARGSQSANTAATSAQNFSTGLQGAAGGISSFLAPELESQAAHPSGISQPDLNAMNTAVQESAGGSQAGAVGEGALRAARTRNAGAGDAAVADSARSASVARSKGALATKALNAQTKVGQQSQALGELGGMYGSTLGGANTALGIVPQAVNADTNAQNASWDWARYLLDPALQAGGSAAAGYLQGGGNKQ